MSLDYVLEQMDKDPRINLVFLDACRDNPLPKTINLSLDTRTATAGQGLAQVKGAIDTLIVGTGMGSTEELVWAYDDLRAKGLRAVSPLAVQKYMPNSPAAATC